MLSYIVESFDRSTKVIDFHYPNELLQRNNWELSDEPETLDDILISCRATLKYAIKTGRDAAEGHVTVLGHSNIVSFAFHTSYISL